MTAVILNSGFGSRMGGRTLDKCKCLVEISDGVTILDNQIRNLTRSGITDFCITTGYFAEKLESYIRAAYPGYNFSFVCNSIYNKTNYIYSLHLASEILRGKDVIMLHGDLVFEQNVLQDLLAAEGNRMIIDTTKPLPEKDFKSLVVNGRVSDVSINSFPSTAGEWYYAQPMYKFSSADFAIWMDAISDFCEEGKTSVYAEDALNLQSIYLEALDVKGRACFEIDNNADLEYGQKVYSGMADRKQITYSGKGSLSKLQIFGLEKPFVVCSTRGQSEVSKYLPADACYFNGFTTNPDIKEAMEGINLFEKEKCDTIISYGGGSAIDTAKAINIINSEKPRVAHITIPTTAGTGSEATCFAVLYENGEKISIEHPELLPNTVILDPATIGTLPAYHKKSTLLDALCQAIESTWAKAQTTESNAYTLSAIDIILNNYKAYLKGDVDAELRILQAANLSGKAINISKTTAAHAMSYKLSTMFGLAHGHAVALCIIPVWGRLADEIKASIPISSTRFAELLTELDMGYSDVPNKIYEQAELLAAQVNTERLNNHPEKLSQQDLADMYREIRMKDIDFAGPWCNKI